MGEWGEAVLDAEAAADAAHLDAAMLGWADAAGVFAGAADALGEGGAAAAEVHAESGHGPTDLGDDGAALVPRDGVLHDSGAGFRASAATVRGTADAVNYAGRAQDTLQDAARQDERVARPEEVGGSSSHYWNATAMAIVISSG